MGVYGKELTNLVAVVIAVVGGSSPERAGQKTVADVAQKVLLLREILLCVCVCCACVVFVCVRESERERKRERGEIDER